MPPTVATSDLRETGIPLLGEMPWGTHLCHFYETDRDLLDALVPYFKTGLENDEFCWWAAPISLTPEEAKRALRQGIPDLDRHLAHRRIEIVSHHEWYLQGGHFDLHRTTAALYERLEDALARGFAGMRVNGSPAGFRDEEWEELRKYEAQLDDLIEGRRLIILCTYGLAATPAGQLLDAARIHQCATARRFGHWEILETPATKRARREIEKLNEELEQRVVERTGALETANRELRAVSRRLMQAREDERQHLARELHDEIGQALTAAKLNLENVRAHTEAGRNRSRLEESITIVNGLLEQVRQISLDLRPTILDDLGLVPALRWYLRQQSERAGFSGELIDQTSGAKIPPNVATTCFRIAQEAITNIIRHAGAQHVAIELRLEAGELSLLVRDDGTGFDVAASQRRAEEGTSLGLPGMKERALLVGGRFEIQSAAGQGTEVRARLPMPTQEIPEAP